MLYILQTDKSELKVNLERNNMIDPEEELHIVKPQHYFQY